MEEQTPSPKRRLDKKSGTSFIIILCIIIAILLSGLFYFYPQKNSNNQPPNPQTSPAVIPPSEKNVTTDLSKPAEIPKTDSTIDNKSDKQETPFVGKEPPEHPDNSAVLKESQGISSSPDRMAAGINKTDPKEPTRCDTYVANVDYFFETLDNRAYIHDFNINEKSNTYFPKLIQRLADNPPVVTGETDDLFTVLKNTAHFFRIIGKKNILILKGILDREKPTFEQTLSDFYILTQEGDCLKNAYNLNISEESLYLYSGFFLNTMGGRLYLFRRDSMSRMVVNYYALVIMDKANREGRNKYGISIRDAIDNLINEIESSKIELQMRDHYLDTLYDMKEIYQ